MEILGLSLFALAVLAFLWLLPVIIIAFSNKTRGLEKLGWILAVVFISWFAWILYLIIAPIDKRS